MIISYPQMKKIVFGAVSITRQSDGSFGFSRFTKEQTAFFDAKFASNRKYFEYVFGCAGIRLDFFTDASSAKFSVVSKALGNLRRHYLDILIDSQCEYLAGGEGDSEENYEIYCKLPQGKHRVSIYFPPYAEVKISPVVLENATFCIPYEYKRLLYVLGDSISQGFTCRHPSACFAAKLARLIDADMLSGAVGGDTFSPDAVFADINPDIITVAYGTNDYAKSETQTITDRQTAVLLKLKEKYPLSKIVAISPIYRKTDDREAFFEYSKALYENAKRLGFDAVCGLDIFPYDDSLFEDGCLHPNDRGFEEYVSKLLTNSAFENL